ncbi:MAG: hypothetical protein WKF34_05895 [Pyrinomonadaceae bacterium]
MKKILVSSFLIFSALLVMQTICQAQTVQTVPLYRLRYVEESTGSSNGVNQSEHFYTANTAERDSLLKNSTRNTTSGGFSYFIRFRDEGIEGYVSPKQVPGTVPLYRLYKDPMKHFYTADAAEKDKAISQYGYKFESIVGYVSAVQIPGTTPLYRVYRATKGKTRDDHFYTIKEDEKFGAIHKYGYVDEGIRCYVWTSAVTLSTALPIRIR